MTRSFAAAVTGITLSLLLGGCAQNNPYAQYYRYESGTTPEMIASTRPAPAPATPLVDHTNADDFQKVARGWAARSYAVIGQAQFNSGASFTDAPAIAQAKAVKADLVLIVNPRYVGSFQTSTPVVTPTISTSSIQGAALGTVTGTTVSTTTQYVPGTEHRADYAAVFFVKQQPPVFGARTENLNDEEKAKRGSNYGVKATIIIENSPAYKADVLVGDIIESIDGEKVMNVENASDILTRKQGKQVTVVLNRNGKLIEKSTQLNTIR